MPWPTDPVKLEEARRKHREAQQKRWQNNPAARDRMREKAVAQWSSPEARARMSEIKKRCYLKDPTLNKRVAAGIREAMISDPVRRMRLREWRKQKRNERIKLLTTRKMMIAKRVKEQHEANLRAWGVTV